MLTNQHKILTHGEYGIYANDNFDLNLQVQWEKLASSLIL